MQSMGMVNVCKRCYMNEHGSVRCHFWPVWNISRIRLRSKTGRSCQGGWVLIVLSPALEFFTLVFRHFADPFNIDKRKWEVCTYLYELLCYSQWCEILHSITSYMTINELCVYSCNNRTGWISSTVHIAKPKTEWNENFSFFLFKLFSQFAKSYSSHYSR